MIKAVLFDLDGTLINTNELIIETFKYVYKTYLGLKIETSEIIKYFGEPLKDTFRRYDEKNAESLIEIYKAYNASKHDKMVCSFEGARETLFALKDMGIKVGVVTSKRREMANRGLRITNLEDLMDVIITPEDTIKHKPDPEPILAACKLLDLMPMEVLYVGDTSYDIKCSKNAGTRSCLVKYTMLPIEELMKLEPDFVIESLLSIPDIVENENKVKSIS